MCRRRVKDSFALSGGAVNADSSRGRQFQTSNGSAHAAYALRQRPSQATDTGIQDDLAIFLGIGARAGLTAFGRSNDSATFLSRSENLNDHRSKHKQCYQNQATQCRRSK